MNELCKQLTHGVYIIAVSDGDTASAFTAAWVMQVSFKPPLLAIAINPNNYSYTLLKKSGVCTVNVLAKHQLDIAEHFGKPHHDKMAGFNWQQGITTAPVLADALAYFDCKLSHEMNVGGDHHIVVCEILDGKQLHTGKPMLYQETGDMDGSDTLY